MKSFHALFVLAGLLLAATCSFADDLSAQFRNPPDAAKPWVYWFWLDGNITREGITADLEAMHRVGIGGVLIMEVDQGIPKGPARFGSPQWRELFKHVMAEAGRLGIEVDMNNDAGWCGSGGPWVTPQHAMQKVVWSETFVEGPRRFEGPLPQPETVAGYYRDIAVLAFPSPADDADPKKRFRIAHIDSKNGLVARMGMPDCRLRPSRRRGPGGVRRRPRRSARSTAARSSILPAGSTRTDALSWDVPPGKWTLLRLGHTPTGAVNAPAPAEGRGLECDKLSREAIDEHFAGLMAKLIADVGPAAGKTLTYTHIDSWEIHSQNWTPRMREEFQKRRGYDPLPLLPAMTGRVVDSLEVSERFLWDLRKTIAELNDENYAGRLRELAHQHGMQLSIEAYGDGLFDDLSYAGRADSPMCEFWMGGGAMETVKEMASAGHTYGRNIVGAESFTAVTERGQMDEPSVLDQGPGRRRLLRGRQPLRLPPLRPSAVARPRARHDDGPLGHPLRADRDVVGADAALARVPGPLQPPAAARAVRRRPVLSPDGRFAEQHDLRPAHGLRLRRLLAGSRAHADERPRRPARAARRHELSAPGAAAERDDDARAAGQDQGIGRGRGDGGRAAAAEVAQPERLSAVRRPGAGACRRVVGRLRRQDDHRAPLRQGQSGLGQDARSGAGGDGRAARFPLRNVGANRRSPATSTAPPMEPTSTSSPTAARRRWMPSASSA